MNPKIIFIISVLNLVLILLILLFFIRPKISESFTTQEQAEAIATVAGLYNSGQFTVTNLNVTDKFNMLPTGVIIAFFGKTVPDGWALCDGSKGTPDLRNKFIYGGNPNEMGQKGGQDKVTLTVANLAPHSHPYSDTGPYGGGSGFKGGDYGWQHPKKNTETTGSGAPFSILPPYLKLAFIMKL